MKVALSFFQPSSPRWFLFPGQRDRGFFNPYLVKARLSTPVLVTTSIVKATLEKAVTVKFVPVKLLLVAMVSSWLAACSAPSIDRYMQREPAFDPETFFSGFITAHGVIKDFSGEVIRTFNADIDACWRGDVVTLDERFIFDDGEHQTRLWTLKRSVENLYTATASDVVGTGNAVTVGNAFFLDYILRVELDTKETIDLRIDDRMYRVSENVVINQSTMNKWGVSVGEILLTLVRHPEQQATCAPN